MSPYHTVSKSQAIQEANTTLPAGGKVSGEGNVLALFWITCFPVPRIAQLSLRVTKACVVTARSLTHTHTHATRSTAKCLHSFQKSTFLPRHRKCCDLEPIVFDTADSFRCVRTPPHLLEHFLPRCVQRDPAKGAGGVALQTNTSISHFAGWYK